MFNMRLLTLSDSHVVSSCLIWKFYSVDIDSGKKVLRFDFTKNINLGQVLFSLCLSACLCQFELACEVLVSSDGFLLYSLKL